MKKHGLESLLAAADPVDRERLERLDFDAMEADLIADLDGVPSGPQSPSPAKRSRPRRLALALAVTALASALLAFLLIGGTRNGHPSPAYGAELVRFAESTPLLLLEAPGWRVEDVYEAGQGTYIPRSGHGEGSMEFVTGPEIPNESTRISADGAVSGMAPKAVRQRKVTLSWHLGKLGFPGPVVSHPVEAPVLDTTALVNTRAETSYIVTKNGKKRIDWGGPGDHQMVAIWQEGGYTLELRAWVPDLSAFEERLGWLARVDSQSWLDAMPPEVVKATEHDATVREMLKGIPVPHGFDPSQIPDEGLTTSRYQVGATVTGSPASGSANGAKPAVHTTGPPRGKPSGRWPARSTGRSCAR